MRKIIAIGIFLVLVGVVFAATPVNAAITSYAQPDATYLAEATEKIDISGLTDGTSYTSITDGYMTVTFGSDMEKRTVPGGWSTWSSPPWSETATPHVLFETTETSLTWKLSKPTWVFGFELEPNAFAVFECTVEFYAGGTLLGTITQDVDGYYGARLFAAKSLDDPIDRVEIKVPSGAGGFAVAQIRYNPIFIEKHYTYTDVDFEMEPAELGTPLKSIHMVINHDKVKSHNPGQFYAVIEITGPVQNFRFWDNFDEEFDVHPSKIGTGGCQVILLKPGGFAEVITDSPDVEIKEIDNEKNYVAIDFDLPKPLEPGYKILVYIKFETAYKHEKYGGDSSFWDEALIDINPISAWDFVTEAKIPITGVPT